MGLTPSERASGLAYVLDPKSVAVAGASEREGVGRTVFRNLLDFGFQGNVVPVNPRYEAVFGQPSFPSILAVEDDIDCYVLAIPAQHVLRALEDGRNKGIRSAIVLASGFGETGPDGQRLQREIQALARDTGIRILGPNCLGFINAVPNTALYSGPLPGPNPLGRLGVVSQSGAFSVSIMWALLERQVGFRYLISSGNEADLEASEYIEFMVNDPDIDVVACFIEGLKNPQRFLSVAHTAVEAEKPIIVLKSGRSPTGSRATVAHTGALAGNDAVYDAALKQANVVRVADVNEFIESAELFLKSRPPRGTGVGIVTISGGEASMLSDVATDVGIELPSFSERTSGELSRLLPGFLTPANPLDNAGGGAAAAIIHQRDITEFAASLRTVASDENINLLVVSQDAFNRQAVSGERRTALSLDVAAAAAEVLRDVPKPVVLLSATYGGVGDELLRYAGTVRLPVVQGIKEGLSAVGHLVRYWSRREAGSLEEITVAAAREARQLPEISELVASRHKVGTISEGLSVLEAYGIPTAKGGMAASAGEAAAIAGDLGYPVVLKLEGRIPHKTETDAVMLDIRDPGELDRAYEVLARRWTETEGAEGIFVQEMVFGGVECIVGFSEDPQFGPVVAFGVGGIFVEMLDAVSLRLPPITRAEARPMIEQGPSGRLFRGFRGKGRLDCEAAIDAIISVSRMALDLGEALAEVDVNPLFVFEQEKGVKAADALVVGK